MRLTGDRNGESENNFHGTAVKTVSLQSIRYSETPRLCYRFWYLHAAALSVVTRSHPGILMTIVGMYGLLYCVNLNAHNAYGSFTFAFTGFMGYTLGPILTVVLNGYANGVILTTTTMYGDHLPLLLLHMCSQRVRTLATLVDCCLYSWLQEL